MFRRVDRMKNKINSLVSILIIICLVLSASTSFADASDVKWGMTEDEVVSLMGMKGETDDTSSSGSHILRYNHQKLSAFEDTKLIFIFRNDSLFCKAYGMQSEISKTAFNYLGEALEIKYGSPSNDTSPVLDVIYLMGVQIDEATLSMLVSASVAKYKVWKPDEENNIVLLYFNSDEEVTTLFYIQPSSEVPEKDYNFDGL